MVTLPHPPALPVSSLASMSYRFRPPLWSIAGTLAVGALFVTLGVWQLDRGHSKARLHAAFDASSQVLSLGLETPPPDMLAAPQARAEGRYDSERQILLDNQTRDRVPGYRVWTPLRLREGGWLMVDRGWVAAAPDRSQLPLIEVDAAPRPVSGHWRPIPEPGLRLDSEACTGGVFPRVLNYPTRELLSCVLGGPVANGLLLLDPTATDGFVREWALPNPVPPARHYAYAAQWFAFAATLLFFFIKLNLRRLP